MTTRTLEIKFIGDSSGATRAFAEVDDAGGKLGGKLDGLKSAFGGVATVAGGIIAAGALQKIGGFLQSAVTGAIDDEAATKRLEQALRNIGGAYDQNLAKVNAAIDAGAKKAFTDDQVRDSFQTLLGATGDVNEALNRQQLAYDLSRGAGIDLEQATRMVAKVNEESVDTFKRLGINIKDGATEAEALAAVQEKFAGQADAYAQSTAGQFEQANIRLSEVKEQIGTALLPVIAKLGTVFLEQVVPAIERFVNAAGPAIRQFAQDAKRYWESDLKPAIDNLQAAWEKIDQVVIPILKIVKDNIELMAKNGALFLGIIVDFIQGDFSGAWDKFKEMIGNAVQFAKDTLGNLKDFFGELIPLLVEAAKNLGEAALRGLKNGIVWIWDNELKPFLTGLPGNIVEALGDLGQLLVETGKSLAGGFVSGVQGALGNLMGIVAALVNPVIDAFNNTAGRLPGVDNIPRIGGGGSSNSVTGNPVPGGDDDTMTGREVFGQEMGGGGGGGVYTPSGAYGRPLTNVNGQWLDLNAIGSDAGPGAQHRGIVRVTIQGDVYARDHTEQGLAAGDLAFLAGLQQAGVR